ncbi:MAG TPA: hypothetical protein VIS10_10255 [Anaerolineales bacterium]
MSEPQNAPTPKSGSPVYTACKGIIFYEDDTPTAVFGERRLYFCLPSCLRAFQEDPKTSCLADEINSENN